MRIAEPARLPLTPEDLLEDAVRVEQPDPRTVLAVGTKLGRTVVTVLKAAAEDGPWIQATCTGLPAEAAALEEICTSLTLTPPAPAARHALPGLPLSVEAPHPPREDGLLSWQFLPEDHELSVLEVVCRRVDRAPSEEALLAQVSPHGEPSIIRLTDGLAVLTEAAGGMTDALVEVAEGEGSWQCRCSSADHLWRQRQALSVCMSLEVSR